MIYSTGPLGNLRIIKDHCIEIVIIIIIILINNYDDGAGGDNTSQAGPQEQGQPRSMGTCETGKHRNSREEAKLVSCINETLRQIKRKREELSAAMDVPRQSKPIS